MEQVASFLSRHSCAGIDTSVFIYHLEDVPPYSGLTQAILEQMVAGSFRGVTSVITLMEIAVQPLARGLPAVAGEYEAALYGMPNLTVTPITAAVARLAAGLRASYRLTPPDALQMAACIAEGATAFITNDRRLARVRDVSVLVLADLL